MTKEYRIEHVKDFLQVPPDRLEDCLEEFKLFLVVVKEASRAIPQIKTRAFIWKDDGKHDCSVSITIE